MSAFGDNRDHMNRWKDELEDRAKEVGHTQAMEEFLKVFIYFIHYHMPEMPRES